MITKVGSVAVLRIGYQMNGGGMYFPLDELLKISGMNITNGLQTMVSYLGALQPLRTASKLIEMFLGVFVSHNFCSKVTCEVGTKAIKIKKRDLKPAKNTPKEEQYIAYQGDGGRARIRTDICPTKEHKVLFQFLDHLISGSTKEIKIPEELKGQYSRELNPWTETKTTLVTNGEDVVQDTVIGSNWEDVMDNFAIEIKDKGYDTTPCNQALVSDGASPIQDGFAKHFPRKEQILDQYHFSEHVNIAAKATFTNELERRRWVKESVNLCFENNSEELLTKIQLTNESKADSVEAKEQLRLLYNYTERNKQRIRYGYFKELGLPIGSGEIEGKIKNMNDIKKIKSASIRWRKENLKKVVALRTVIFNEQFEDLKKVA